MTKTELKEWMWQWLSPYADQYKFMDEFDRKIDEFQFHWNSAKDIPPDETKEYLVVRDGVVGTETWFYRDGKGYWYNYLGITSWAEKPEPPKG